MRAIRTAAPPHRRTAAPPSGRPSGSKTPPRTRALADFKTGRVRVLVATDIAARGLDIAQLPLVVNFDLPLVAEDYVHRVGRTGRAGHHGRAVSLVSSADRGMLNDIQRLLRSDIERIVLDGFESQDTHGPGPVVPARPQHPRAPQSHWGRRRFRPSRSRPNASGFAGR